MARDLLKRVDGYAKGHGSTRSGVLEVAAEAYLAGQSPSESRKGKPKE